MNVEIEHLPSSLTSRYLIPAPPISVPPQDAIKIRDDDEMEGLPAAVQSSAFDVEAQLLRGIEWRPSRRFWGNLAISRRVALSLLPQFYSETAASRIPIGIWDKILRYLADEPETLGFTEEVCKGWYPTSHRLKSSHKYHRYDSMERVRLYARYIETIPRPRRIAWFFNLLGSTAEEGKQRSRAGNQRSDNEAVEEDSETEEDGAAEEGKHRSLALVGTFAAMFAGGQLPRLSELTIEGGEWMPGMIPSEKPSYP
ncbi:hypothetical protein WOLCODRAFT_155178 [Wolfiporia cocos MD-104 SS10]|uniref:F-box domain-containing protein n=1 Tax=Wolfiporia cocos (strain MD-104) TaxID=742152 RepID=A0A2H3IYL4_WOLCO|nr:hypothetical protein WOLCODRAFT_155178 [Wolfiporia cocos MD-104 SS10]